MSDVDDLPAIPVIPHAHELCDGCMESVEYETALLALVDTLTEERDAARTANADLREDNRGLCSKMFDYK